MSEQSPVIAPPADPPSPVQLRRELVDLVIGELRGPADGEHEVLPLGQRPRSRYLIGAVAPSGERYEPERDEDLGAGDADVEEAHSGSDAGVASYLPSSIGMSFHVARETAELAITASWGRYERIRGEGGDALAWHRTPAYGTVEIPMAVGVVVSRPVAEQPDVVVEVHIHDLGDRWAVTTFLRNNQPVPERSKDTAWLFQTQLAVHSPDGTRVFVAAERPVPKDASSEERRLALAYRNRREFAVGHGIAVVAEVDSIDPTRARSIVTQALPMREVAQTGAPDDEPLLTALERDMRTLAVADDDALPGMLQPLIDGYGIWLERQDARVAAGVDGLAEYAETAVGVLADANVALGRMREGLETLRADRHACEAFRFANRVMADQRVHSLWAEHRRRGGEDPYETFDVPSNRSWRPFQLAFLLLGLPAIANPAHPDRSTDSSARGDLLWFPTGGGKTEAYLGLAAFTLAMRRLQGPLGDRRADAGVAVLMRYTLRVLTLQQFQRAAALICACEVARRERSDVWGDEPFRTGLWVGQATTPNTVDQAHDAIRNLHGDGYVRTGGGRPDQLASCPWCGSDIHAGRDIKVETYQAGRARVISYCSDKNGSCAFSRKGSPGKASLS